MFLVLHKYILKSLSHQVESHKVIIFLKELLAFGYKEAISCIFPAIIFGTLAITKFISIPFVPRYDLLLLIFLTVQYFMYKLKLEDENEVRMICIFHLLGVMMEMFKVSHGAWAYPDPGYTKILGVPLYSGFMYASIGSYVCQAWKNLDLKFESWPPMLHCAGVALLIYGNFYSNVYTIDLRLLIIPVLIYVFYNTKVYFNTNGQIRQMPLSLSFFLIGFFVWIAENMATFLGAWKYPNQKEGWTMVSLHIMSSWFLLVVVTVVLVALIKHLEGDPSIDIEAGYLKNELDAA